MEGWKPDPFNLVDRPTATTTTKVAGSEQHSTNFARTAKWSPDSNAVLAQCEDSSFRLYCPGDGSGDPGHFSEENTKVFAQAAPILEYVWFPTASVHDPASFCFVASVRECPVKLLDASDGRLRASYRIVDHRERQIAPHSLAFNLTAQRLYCGFEDAIEVFDISRPGEGTRIHTTPSKKSKDGLKGIVSALAFSPTYGSEESYFAAGSFTPTSNNIGLFSDMQSEPLMFLGGGPRAGVTQMHFNPASPHILYAAYRGSGTGSIYSWDIRSDVENPINVFTSGSMSSKTNQKLKFDVDLGGRMLGVGDQVGGISIFELPTENEPQDDEESLTEREISTHKPALRFNAHQDVVGSVAFHPFKPSLLSVSGSRHFSKYDDSDPSSGDEGSALGSTGRHHLHPTIRDSSITIWDFSQKPNVLAPPETI